MTTIALRTAVTVAALTLASGLAAAPSIATLEVRNVSCASCAPIVRSALSRLPGVSSVSVSERAGAATARVAFDDALISTEAMRKATKDAGFPSTVVEAKRISP